MGLNAGAIKGSQKSNFPPQPDMEEGNYPARLVQVIDLGVQEQRPYKGEAKAAAHEVMFTFELSDSFMVDENGDDILDKPRWLSTTLPLYPLFADRAKSTKLAKALDPKDELAGDFSRMVGLPCNITITVTKKGDKTYTNIVGYTSMRPRDAEKCPELVNPSKVFDLDAPDMEVFNSLPEWLREKIKGNLGFKASKLEEILGGAPKEEKPKEEKKKPIPEVTDEEDDKPW